MLNVNDKLIQFRQTKRTSRMIEHAIQNHPGERVLLFFGTVGESEHAARMVIDRRRQQVAKVCRSDRSLELVTGANLVFKPVDDDRFHWKSQRYEGYPASTPIYLDHSAWERRYTEVLQGYHQWDCPNKNRSESRNHFSDGTPQIINKPTRPSEDDMMGKPRTEIHKDYKLMVAVCSLLNGLYLAGMQLPETTVCTKKLMNLADAAKSAGLGWEEPT